MIGDRVRSAIKTYAQFANRKGSHQFTVGAAVNVVSNVPSLVFQIFTVPLKEPEASLPDSGWKPREKTGELCPE